MLTCNWFYASQGRTARYIFGSEVEYNEIKKNLQPNKKNNSEKFCISHKHGLNFLSVRQMCVLIRIPKNTKNKIKIFFTEIYESFETFDKRKIKKKEQNRIYERNVQHILHLTISQYEFS